MNWEPSGSLGSRLVADDGEILEHIVFDYADGSYRVRSTGKHYTTEQAAKSAAERAHRGATHDR
jgi:hypothetical protein